MLTNIHSLGKYVSNISNQPRLIHRSYFTGAFINLSVLLGINKIYMSSLKYMYQVHLNVQRQNTHGLSFLNILFCFSAACLQYASLILKSFYLFGELTFREMKIPKLMLATVDFSFSLILFAQFWYYKDNTRTYQIGFNSLKETAEKRDSKAKV